MKLVWKFGNKIFHIIAHSTNLCHNVRVHDTSTTYRAIAIHTCVDRYRKLLPMLMLLLLAAAVVVVYFPSFGLNGIFLVRCMWYVRRHRWAQAVRRTQLYSTFHSLLLWFIHLVVCPSGGLSLVRSSHYELNTTLSMNFLLFYYVRESVQKYILTDKANANERRRRRRGRSRRNNKKMVQKSPRECHQ